MPARRAIKLFTNRTGTVHGKNLVTTEKDERNICVYKRITVSLSIYAMPVQAVARGGETGWGGQSSSVNVSGSGPATGHPTRLLTDINTRVPTHTHIYTYICNGRPAACLFICFIRVWLCVCVCGGGAKASDFPIYNYNFIVFTIFIVALASYRTHSDTDLDSDSATVGVWKAGQWQGEGAEDRRQDRTQSTHSLVNAGQRQKLLLMCSNVYVPPYECISVWERGGRGCKGKVAWHAFFLLVCVCVCGLFLFGLMQKRIKWP